MNELEDLRGGSRHCTLSHRTVLLNMTDQVDPLKGLLQYSLML